MPGDNRGCQERCQCCHRCESFPISTRSPRLRTARAPWPSDWSSLFPDSTSLPLPHNIPKRGHDHLVGCSQMF